MSPKFLAKARKQIDCSLTCWFARVLTASSSRKRTAREPDSTMRLDDAQPASHGMADADIRDACPMEVDSDDMCWICLDDNQMSGHHLFQPCRCPRKVHAKCMARWQLQQAGRPEETHCRFCNSTLADWKASLTPENLKPEVKNVQPIMVVYFEGEIHRIPVQQGPDGLQEFTSRIRELFRLPEEVDISLTFGCKEPMSGDHLKLEGVGAFDAAVHCASVAAADRQSKARTDDDQMAGFDSLAPTGMLGSSSSAPGSPPMDTSHASTHSQPLPPRTPEQSAWQTAAQQLGHPDDYFAYTPPPPPLPPSQQALVPHAHRSRLASVSQPDDVMASPPAPPTTPPREHNQGTSAARRTRHVIHHTSADTHSSGYAGDSLAPSAFGGNLSAPLHTALRQPQSLAAALQSAASRASSGGSSFLAPGSPSGMDHAASLGLSSVTSTGSATPRATSSSSTMQPGHFHRMSQHLHQQQVHLDAMDSERSEQTVVPRRTVRRTRRSASGHEGHQPECSPLAVGVEDAAASVGSLTKLIKGQIQSFGRRLSSHFRASLGSSPSARASFDSSETSAAVTARRSAV